MDHAILVLERTFDEEKSAAPDYHAVLLEHIGGNDDVGDAGIVF